MLSLTSGLELIGGEELKEFKDVVNRIVKLTKNMMNFSKRHTRVIKMQKLKLIKETRTREYICRIQDDNVGFIKYMESLGYTLIVNDYTKLIFQKVTNTPIRRKRGK